MCDVLWLWFILSVGCRCCGVRIDSFYCVLCCMACHCFLGIYCAVSFSGGVFYVVDFLCLVCMIFM